MNRAPTYRVKFVSHFGFTWYILSVSKNDVIQLTNNVVTAKGFVKIDECERLGKLKVEQDERLKEYQTEMI